MIAIFLGGGWKIANGAYNFGKEANFYTLEMALEPKEDADVRP